VRRLLASVVGTEPGLLAAVLTGLLVSYVGLAVLVSGTHRVWGVAVLLLGLYVLTGLLAMTHAYQYRDPRSAELREAQHDRERLARVAAERRYEAYLARQGVIAQRDLSRLHREARDRSVGEKEFLGEALHEQSAQEIARHLGNPSATDGLLPPPSS